MCEEDRKALVAERVMNGQLEKRIVLLNHCFEEALAHERELVEAYNLKAIEYWRICLKLRKKLAELSGEIWQTLS